MSDFDENNETKDFVLVDVQPEKKSDNFNAEDAENVDFSTDDARQTKKKIVPPKRKKEKKKNRGATVLIVLIILAAIAFAINVFSTKSGKKPEIIPSAPNFNFNFKPKNALQFPSGTSDYIAELDIEGVIEEENDFYNQENLLDAIERLADESKNKGILLKINSPGGTVYESDEAYLALQKFKEKTKRPIWAYFESLGASGAYYIACSADKIFANRNSLVGSIGVIAGSSVDATGLMEKYGVKMTTFTAGRNKNMLGIDSPLTEEQRKIMQSIADDAYMQFTQIVADSRALPLAQVHDLADGRIYTAKQAKNLKMIDEIMPFEDFCEEMKNSCGDSNLKIEKIDLVDEQSFFDKLRRMSISVVDKLMKSNSGLPSFVENRLENRVVAPSYLYLAN